MEKLSHLNDLYYLWDTADQSCVAQKAKIIIRIIFSYCLVSVTEFLQLELWMVFCTYCVIKFIKSIHKKLTFQYTIN